MLINQLQSVNPLTGVMIGISLKPAIMSGAGCASGIIDN